MALTIIKAKSHNESFQKGLLLCKKYLEDLTPVYVIIPDRASLSTELELIKGLGGDGIINFDVITLNTLARLILPNLEKSTLSKTGMITIIKQIVNQNADKFLTYDKVVKKNNVGFISELYDTILQFKASHITPASILLSLPKMPIRLQKKMNDIYLVYFEYEKYLTDKIFDGPAKFNGAIANIKFSTLVSKSVFWFAKQENFTNQMLSFISELTKYSKAVYVSTSEDFANTKLYGRFVNSLKFDANANMQKFIEINSDVKLLSWQEFARDNIFKFSSDKYLLNSGITLSKYKTIEEEVEGAAIIIFNKIKKENNNFSDFTICCTDTENYFSFFNKIFNRFGIPFNIDIEKKASDNIVVKFLLSAFEILKTHFRSEKVLEFIKNDLNEFSYSEVSDFENYIKKFAIEGEGFSIKFKNENAEFVRSSFFNLLKPLYREFVRGVKGIDFLTVIQVFIKNAKLDEKVLSYVSDENNIIENDRQSTKICYDKVKDTLEELSIVFNDKTLSINELFDILNLSIKNETFTTTPILSNAVNIIDAFDGFFEHGKVVLVIGANEKTFPRVKKDVGLIQDDEIGNLQTEKSLTPSVKEVNERYLHRSYELCFSAPEVHMSFAENSFAENVRPSFIFLNVAKLFNKKIDEQDDCVLCTKEQALFFGLKNYAEALKGVVILSPEKVAATVAALEIDNHFKVKKRTLLHNDNLFFEKGTISVSEIETFASCPYKHFLKYGLNLREQEEAKIESLDTGNLLHRFAELFARDLSNGVKMNDLNKYATTLMLNVMREEEFADIYEVKLNLPILKLLEKEAPKIAITIKSHFDGSDFKPVMFEEKFGYADNSIKGIEIDGLTLVGKFDRIDEFQDKFARIIDYKTGNKDFKFSGVYYGTGLQLVLYSTVVDNICAKHNNEQIVDAKAGGTFDEETISTKITNQEVSSEKICNKKVVGLFYFLIKNKFQAKKIEPLHGIVLNDLEIIKAMDKDLNFGEKSTYLNLALTKDGAINNIYKNNFVSEKELSNLKNSALLEAEQIVKEIKTNYIEPSILIENAILTPCDYCEFKNMPHCKNCKTRKMRSIDKTRFFARFTEERGER